MENMETPQKKGFDSPEIKHEYYKDLHEFEENPEAQEHSERITELLKSKQYHQEKYNSLEEQYNAYQTERSALNAQKVRLNLLIQNPELDKKAQEKNPIALELDNENKEHVLQDLKAQIEVRDMLMKEADEQKKKHFEEIKKIHNELHKIHGDYDNLKNINLN